MRLLIFNNAHLNFDHKDLYQIRRNRNSDHDEYDSDAYQRRGECGDPGGEVDLTGVQQIAPGLLKGATLIYFAASLRLCVARCDQALRVFPPGSIAASH